MTLATLVDAIIAKRIPVRIVSPHLDDAVLSCGDLMTYLADKTDVEVWTIFTEAGEPPYTLSAKAFLSQCGISDAKELFAARRDEDRDVLGRIGVRGKHLGYSDALFRKRNSGRIRRKLGLIVPEICHTYPTYRFHITSGVVSPVENDLLETLTGEISALTKASSGPIVLFPLGLGKHVDHEILHQVGLCFPGDVLFYSDFPYCLVDAPDTVALQRQGIRSLPFEHISGQKSELIREYVSQPLFQGEIPSVPEVYHISDSLMKRI